MSNPYFDACYVIVAPENCPDCGIQMNDHGHCPDREANGVCFKGSRPDYMTAAQYDALKGLCEHHGARFNVAEFRLYGCDGDGWLFPDGHVSGWAGPYLVGCSPEGRISS